MVDSAAVVDPKDARWWLSGQTGYGDEAHEVVDRVLAALKPWFDARKHRHNEYLRAYGLSRDNQGQSTNNPWNDQFSFGQAANIIDTVVTKVCKSRIVPMALTSGGTWTERQRSKQFNRFISGLFWEAGVFENDYRWTSDCLVRDSGVAKVCERGGRVVVERCDPDLVYWDPGEAFLTGKVRTIYEESFIDRMRLVELLKQWGEDSADNVEYIRDLHYESKDDPLYASPHNADLIRVREAWHLPSAKGASDGKHVFTVKGRTLFLEDYDEEHLPHEFLNNRFPLFGLTAPPMMARLIGPQKEIDLLTDKLRDAHNLLAVPRIFIRRGANINKAEIDDVPGSFIQCDDPQGDVREWNAQPAHPDTYSFRGSLISEMEKAAGVPETNIQGKPPEGISAAKALQLLDDLVAERLTQFIRCREKFYCAIAEKALAVARKSARGGKYKVLAETREGHLLEEIELADVDIPVGSYRLKVFPTSFLSQSPAARYEFLSEMRQRGDIDELEFRQLVDMPDLESENDLETATLDIVDSNIDAIMTRGLALVAEEFDDHALIVQRGSKAYNLARLRAPERTSKEYKEFYSRLRALKEYVLSAMHFIKPPPQPAVGPQGQPGPGGPPGMQDQGIMGMVQPGAPGTPPPAIAPGTPAPVNPFAGGPNPAEVMSNG